MSNLRRIPLGDYTLTEIRLYPQGQADVIVMTDPDEKVTNEFLTFEWVDGTIDLANAMLQGRNVRVLLEVDVEGLTPEGYDDE